MEKDGIVYKAVGMAGSWRWAGAKGGDGYDGQAWRQR